MKELKKYLIPISSLKQGLHTFDYQLDKRFFECFEASPVQEGSVTAKFYFDKQSGMYSLIFDLEGEVLVECDRCLEFFNMPIKSSNSLVAKFNASEADDMEIIHIPRTETEINIAAFLYEFVILSIPAVKKHDDAGLECPTDMFDYLDDYEEEETSEPNNNPFLDVLKDFDTNK